MRRYLQGLPFAAALLLSGCGIFSADKPVPTPLQSFTPALDVSVAWSAKVDSVQFPLEIAVKGTTLVVAGSDGGVTALDAASGRELWRGQAGRALSAGVGSDGRFAAVVTRDNELVVMDNGNVKWRETLNSRVATAPLVAGERVFVMGVDRAVRAYDAADGRYLWLMQRPGDALTLAEPSVLAPFKDTLLVGQGARLTGVDPLQGTVRWEVSMATPRGTNEVERLADLVGPPARSGDIVCARAFQSAVACANAERGSLLWSKNVGGIQPIGADAELVFGGDANDRLTAWRAGNGDVAWTSEKFLHRSLSGFLSTGKAVVFGDFEGQVHFLSRDKGETLARVPTDGSAIVGAPVMAGGLVVVATHNGGIYALRTP
jgi:outer membrane assembly lipoprotein YfgL